MTDSHSFRIVVSRAEIQKRVATLGRDITETYRGKGRLAIVGVLKGSFIFMADLVREIDLDVTIDFVELSSYGDRTESSGVVRIHKDLKHSAEGCHILIVEDIVDTGLTIKFLRQHIESQNPLSVRVCSLLRKPSQELYSVGVDFSGFELENEFVVGYGLDYAGRYRNLKDIVALGEGGDGDGA